jgi:dTDP-4-dehydrorhamnose reductase
MKQLVMILGAGGQLGTAMADGLARHHEIISRTRGELDITNAEAVRADITAIYPDVIVNCAAYTNVDGAETDQLSALATNAWAVRAIARVAAELDATLVHYSTDFVFDGAASAPYSESDLPNPRSVYAMSKLLGEWFAAEAPRHYVLRVESLFGGSMTSSVDRLLQGILAGTEVRAFSDRTVSPSYVDDVVKATRDLFEGGKPFGLYHCVNTGWTTWFELARRLAVSAARPDARVTPFEMAASGLRAPRPKFAALSNRKLTENGVTMPTWEQALDRYVTVTRSNLRRAPQSPATT